MPPGAAGAAAGPPAAPSFGTIVGYVTVPPPGRGGTDLGVFRFRRGGSAEPGFVVGFVGAGVGGVGGGGSEVSAALPASAVRRNVLLPAVISSPVAMGVGTSRSSRRPFRNVPPLLRHSAISRPRSLTFTRKWLRERAWSAATTKSLPACRPTVNVRPGVTVVRSPSPGPAVISSVTDKGGGPAGPGAGGAAGASTLPPDPADFPAAGVPDAPRARWGPPAPVGGAGSAGGRSSVTDLGAANARPRGRPRRAASAAAGRRAKIARGAGSADLRQRPGHRQDAGGRHVHDPAGLHVGV